MDLIAYISHAIRSPARADRGDVSAVRDAAGAASIPRDQARVAAARWLCRELPLGFLTCQDVEAFLKLEFPIHELSADLATLIHARTEGHPAVA